MDDSRIARDISAYELAASALENWLGEEFEPEDIETQDARKKLQIHLSLRNPDYESI